MIPGNTVIADQLYLIGLSLIVFLFVTLEHGILSSNLSGTTTDIQVSVVVQISILFIYLITN